MEFWGVEVKAGQPFLVDPKENFCLHLSQAALGELKKDQAGQYVCLYLKHASDPKLVIGTLSHEKFPQVSFDLVVDKPFVLSHNYKDGSVYFTGYQVKSPGDGSEDEESEDEEELLPQVAGNGKSEASKIKPAVVPKKPDSGKQRVNFVEPKKDVKAKAAQSDESDDDDEDDSDEEDDSSDDEIPHKLAVKGDDEDSDDDSDEDEDTTPMAAEPGPGKKRSGSATKNPISNKKARLVTPQKTDGKKASGHVHIATPYPNKGKEAKQQAQKSGGSFSCKSCSKSFGSQMGVDSHTKDKHGSSS
jgi:nucleophosmin 1